MIKPKQLITLFLLGLSIHFPLHAQAHNSDRVMEKAIFQYINAYRVKQHLRPLKMNAAITRQARIHSQDMAAHRMPFGHQGFNKRIKILYSKIKLPQGGAENVAYNYKTAKIVAEGWIASPGHRRNLRGNYNLTGIGIARDKQGKPYFTQIFIRSGY